MDSDINSFWLTAKGIGPRLSDGQGAERTMWATAVNLMGWIDVAVGARTVNVHVNPMVVSEMVVALLPEALKCASEGHRITIHTPLISLTKAQIIQRGLELGVDYGLTHSCYDPSPEGVSCGECDSCQLRLRGFAEAGSSDPIAYQK